jgi:hypothetical protein
MTRRTVRVVVELVEESDSIRPSYDFDTDGEAMPDEPSRIVPRLPGLAKCGADLMQLAKRVAR